MRDRGCGVVKFSDLTGVTTLAVRTVLTLARLLSQQVSNGALRAVKIDRFA